MAVHPFYPPDLKLPNYVNPTLSLFEILIPFFGAILGVMIFSYLMTFPKRSTLSSNDRFTVVWFGVCGCIHTFFEGYFVVNHSSIVGDNSFFGQVWKEYAMSDSRYLISDPTVLIIELLTAFIEGPLCFLTIHAIMTRKNYRHVLQIIISFGQLYGCILYYLTSYLDNFKHSHPSPMYFYGYFVLMNLPWIYIPIKLLSQSFEFIMEQQRKRKFF
jgi:cholestenol delta-isomerase